MALKAILARVKSLLSDLPNQHAGSQLCFDLEDLPHRLSAEMPDGVTKRLQRVLLTVSRRLLTEEKKHGAGPKPQEAMRDLAGVWLGLYFLGTPFPHPWEPVARHAERNGYYREGGIFKAAGDVYRTVRRGWLRDPASAKPIFFFDRRPLAYAKLVEAGHKPGADLTEIVTALGACYEMVQLRLYIRSGGPIQHVILENSLRKLVKKSPANAAAMVKLAAHVYGSLPPKLSSQQIIIIIDGSSASGQLARMAGCVLSPDEGVYRFLLSDRGGENGNRLTDAQRSTFLTTLEGVLGATSGLRPVTDADKLQAYLDAFASVGGPAEATTRQPLA